MYIRCIETKAGPHWQLRGKNHQIMASSEIFASRGNCLRAAGAAGAALSMTITINWKPGRRRKK